MNDLGIFCTSIEDIDFQGRLVSDKEVDELRYYPNLRRLDASCTALSDEMCQLLPLCPKLQYLNLSNCPITDVALQYIADLQHLHFLNLNNCNISDRGVVALSRIVTLVQLFLDGTLISNIQPLATLEGLERISIADTPIQDGGIAQVGRSFSFTSLAVQRTPLRFEGSRLEYAMPWVQRINAKGTHCSDDGLLQIAKFASLRSLDISATQVTDKGIKDFRQRRPEVVLIQR